MSCQEVLIYCLLMTGSERYGQHAYPPQLLNVMICLALLLQNPEYYEYMKSYSPVDNIQRADYPNIMVTAGLHDPRVGYW